MNERRYYRFDDLTSVHHGVVISQPRGEGPVTVYVPPREDELPSEQTFETMLEAEEFASAQLAHVGGTDTYVVTQGTEKWWLANLTPVD